MSSIPEKINSKELLMKLEGQSSMLSNNRAKANKQLLSEFNNELSGALKSLSQMDNSEKLREDAIRNGKAIIKNWQPPSDAQIDKIFDNLSKEFLA